MTGHSTTGAGDWYQPNRAKGTGADPAGLTSPSLVGLVADAVGRSKSAGCSHPIRLVGRTDTVNPTTGEIVASFTGERGQLVVPCGDRRAAVCPACARVYRGDTFHLIRAGLAGGKGVPATVTGHPSVFVTLTAPSFGPVHTRRADRQGRALPCRPRRQIGTCEHARPVACHQRHTPVDGQLGQPLCPDCWDYVGAVLWQAHAGRLWDRFSLGVRRRIARAAGLPVRQLRDHARVSFARVAEYQRRGLVHVHAVIRIDGPDGPGQPPPAWASTDLLTDAVRGAHQAVEVTTPYTAAVGERVLRWGQQVDVRPVTPDGDRSRHAVAAYIAKYATKSTEAAGASAQRIRRRADLDAAVMTPHARQLAATCWRLGGLPEYRHLRLRAWAHTLGYRGHCTSKSRTYSTTLHALRQARAEHRRPASSDPLPVVVERDWRYAGRSFRHRGEATGGGRG